MYEKRPNSNVTVSGKKDTFCLQIGKKNFKLIWKKCYSLLHCWWEYTRFRLCEQQYHYLLKLNMQIPFDPFIPLLGISPTKMLVRVHKHGVSEGCLMNWKAKWMSIKGENCKI